MNILILTGRFGMGHYSAAEAVRQKLLKEESSVNIDVVDIIDYVLPRTGGAVYGGFNFMVSRCSKIYNLLNDAAGRYSNVPFKHAFVKKMDQLMDEYKPDFIIATLPVCSQYISAYKTMKKCEIPLYTYVTDITAHVEWIAPHTDRYFVGDQSTRDTLIRNGVEEGRIVISGIPVKQVFQTTQEEKTKSRIKEILIMGGGLGLVPSSDTLLTRLSAEKQIHITLIAGNNKRLYNKLKHQFPEITVIGFTDRVHEYMKKADLIVTKSGGITTFEAIYTETPLYIITPFLAQEAGNAQYIEKSEIGKVLWSEKEDIAKDVIALLSDEGRLAQMQKNMREIKKQMNTASPLAFYYEKEGKLCG
ncbi:MAG: glycosyltransferase [Lachnospiraceae bacterium]